MQLAFNPFTGTLDLVGTTGGGATNPAGPNGAVQFNNGGVFGGDAGLTWLTATQRLGIGTQTPGFPLHVAGNVQETVGVETANDTAATAPRLSLLRARGTEAAPTPAIAGTILGQLLWFGYDAGTPGPPLSFPFSTASIQAIADETFAAGTNYGGHLRFFTTLIGAAGALERLRIADDGSVLVATTAKIVGAKVVITGGALQVIGGNALRLQGGGAGFTSFVDPSHAANIAYTLPSAQAAVAGQLLANDATGVLSWVTPSSAPSGPAGRDLSGTYPDPTVAKINGVPLGVTTATDKNILIADGTNWVSRTLSGDLSITVDTGITALVNFGPGAIGPIGDATHTPAITTDAKGRVQALTSVLITPAAASITGGQALTKLDDTNVTLALGGTPATALLQATSLTLGWTGQLAVGRGGTGLASGTSGGILGFTAPGTLASSVLLTANALVLGGGAGATPTTPVGLGTTTTVLHGNAAGAPSFGAVVLGAGGDVTGTLLPANGGTGQTTLLTAFTALAGTVLTTTGDLLTLSGGVFSRVPIGTPGQVLTVSGGLPTWQTSTSGTVKVSEDAGATTTVDTLDFTEPDGTLITFPIATTARLAMNSFLRLAGRTGTTNNPTISTDSDGTLTGSASGSAGTQSNTLRLFSNSNAPGTAVAAPILLQSNWATLASGRNSIFTFNAPITLLSGATITGYELGSLRAVSVTWKAQHVAASSSPHFLFYFGANLQNDPSGTARGTGAIAPFVNSLTMTGDNAQVRTSSIRTVRETVSTAILGAGTVLIDELTEVFAQPNLVPAATITIRRGLWYRDQQSPTFGRQSTSVAVDVDEQTSNAGFTQVAAVRSAITDAGNSTKMFLQDTGGARSEFAGKLTRYNNVATASTSWGIPGINGYGRIVGTAGAVASVASFTPANDGTFLVSANVLVTTSTTHNFTVTCAYTDEGNSPRTVTLNFSTVGGAIATPIINTGGAVPYHGLPLHIRAKAATAITIATTGTFTTVVYNVEGTITQLA